MEYIQLPPIMRDTDPHVVELVWKFAQLSKDSQDVILQKLMDVYGYNEKEEETKNITTIQKEEIQECESLMNNIINQMLLECCELACWVFQHKYILGESLENMASQKPEVKELIILLDAISTQYMQDTADPITS